MALPKAVSMTGGNDMKKKASLLGVNDKVSILGVEIAVCSTGEAVAHIENFISTQKPHSLFIANAHTLNLGWIDPEYRQILNTADLVLNDGAGVSWAARRQGVTFKQNLVGTDFIPRLCALTEEKGYSYFFLGAAPGVAQAAGRELKGRYPGIKVAGVHHGYFSGEEEGEVLQEIRNARPDILLVAMGNPLQEKWIYRHRDELGGAVAIGVGALFDYLSGRVPRAPAWMRHLGCEWLYRLAIEPRRLWRRYVLGNPLFIWRVLRTGTARKRP